MEGAEIYYTFLKKVETNDFDLNNFIKNDSMQRIIFQLEIHI